MDVFNRLCISQLNLLSQWPKRSISVSHISEEYVLPYLGKLSCSSSDPRGFGMQSFMHWIRSTLYEFAQHCTHVQRHYEHSAIGPCPKVGMHVLWMCNLKVDGWSVSNHSAI
jgi:hypothetical protein